MELVTKNKQKVAFKEMIEYVDKKTGEIKQLYKIYLTDLGSGIQEQLLVRKEDYVKIEKDMEGLGIFDRNNYGCYFKGINTTSK